MKTVITHFYNEAYLLPQWLEHHKKYFDFGVLIDYQSTDNSVEICKQICPYWQVLPSGNHDFDSSTLNDEVMFIEGQLQGWRIALTTTEFLVGDVDKLFIDTPDRMQWRIPGIRFTEWDPAGKLDITKPLWNQLKKGVHYKTDPIAHQCRSLHNYNDIKYEPGRHFLPYNTEDACIFHYAHCLVGSEMIKRRLQIQHKMSMSDKQRGIGTHHFSSPAGLSFNELYRMHLDFISQNESDCSEFIDSIVK